MNIVLGSDHAGFALKNLLKAHMQSLGHHVDDVGTHSQTSCDYPDIAAAVAKKVQAGGSGVGMSMAANRFPGVRAALCTNEYLARMSRLHNNANVLCLGERIIGPDLAKAIAEVFVSTAFEGGRHLRRVEAIEQLSTTL
jgi:ribose 5-phosphate isomerase B